MGLRKGGSSQGHFSHSSAYLVLLPHGTQGFHFMLTVLAILQALVAHGAPAAHTVHAVVFQFMVRACGEFAGTPCPHSYCCHCLACPTAVASTITTGGTLQAGRWNQVVLGKGAPWWVALELAGSAVQHLALLTQDSSWFRGATITELALGGGSGTALLVALHNGLQQPVALEATEAALVQGGAAVALRACEGRAGGSTPGSNRCSRRWRAWRGWH